MKAGARRVGAELRKSRDKFLNVFPPGQGFRSVLLLEDPEDPGFVNQRACKLAQRDGILQCNVFPHHFGKSLKGALCLLRQEIRECWRIQQVKQGSVLTPRKADELGACPFPDTSGWDIHDPEKAFFIVGIGDEVQIGKNILDLLPLIEGNTTNDPIRQAASSKSILNGSGLGIGPVENGKVLQVVFPSPRFIFDCCNDPVSFLPVVGIMVHRDVHSGSPRKHTVTGRPDGSPPT